MKMKYPGKCVVCGKPVAANEQGFWQKDKGVKHEACGEAKELSCIICGGPAGCPECEFREDCDLDAVSQLCVCGGCMGKGDVYSLYREAAGSKFPLLNLKI
ncbi:conserved hypothetical protein [Cenarchaeum symbiosum A]|uniref:Uncharacterized protein n=1 Tax=Cenarchaeum symbiosum (strain A) TaxID=414004 RepID=A0RY56_CENSY|nr:conserved hypothetical protein [Cenarchaeum symbiosum A]